MAISLERIREIEKATVGQAQNPLWHEYRKNRLTASQFGRALTAYASLRDYKSTNKLDEMRHWMVTSGNYTNPAIELGWKHEATYIVCHDASGWSVGSNLEVGWMSTPIHAHKHKHKHK